MNSLDFSSIFAASPGPYLLLSPDAAYTILAVNDAYLAATMTMREQLVGRSLFDAFPDNPSDPAANGVRNLHASLEHVLRHRVAHAMAIQKYDIRRPDGTFAERYWSPINTPVFDQDPTDHAIKAIIHHVHDVTDYVRLKQSGLALQQSNDELREQSGRKHVEATAASRRLHESEQRLHESTLRIAEFEQRQVAEIALREVAGRLQRQTVLFDSIASTTPDFLYILDREGRFIYANRRLLEVWGTTFDNAAGKSMLELGYPQWHADMHLREIKEIIQTKQPVKGEVPFTGGSGISGVYEYIFTPVLGPDGNVEVIAGTTRDVTERRNAEAAVRDAEQRYRTLFESSRDAKIIYTAEGTVIEANPAACQMYGYAADEIVGIHAPDVIHPDARPMFEEFRRVAGAGGVYRCETLDRRQDGSAFPIEVLGTSFTINGRTHLMSVIRDITERKRAEDALGDADRRYRAIFDATADGLIINSPEGQIIDVNPAACRMHGYTREEFLSTPPTDFIHPDDLPLFGQFLETTARGESFHAEARDLRKDGSEFPVEVRGTSFMYNGQHHILGVVRDITERKRAEDALRESEERLRLGLDAGAVGTWDWDIPANKVTWSERVYEFHGLKPGEFGGRVEDFGKMVHPEDAERVDSAIRASVRDRTPYDAEFRVIHPSGEIHWLATSGKVYYGSDGQPLRMVGATSDVTSRRYAAEERERLLAAERSARSEAERVSRMKDEFLATLSHELRTPLNAILGWSQILADGGREGDDLAEGLRIISRNARAQTQIIEDLLDMSRIISGKVRLDVQRVDLPAVLRDSIETVKPAADAKGVRVVMVLDGLAGPVSGDPNRLQQVVWNLLSNAVKFTPRGGAIRVVLERATSHVEVSVVDTGEGISPDFLPYVFDRFSQSDASTTRRHGGLGLGLAIAKQLVELHGGSIRVKSQGPGEGSTFTVTLPLGAIHEPPALGSEAQHSSALVAHPLLDQYPDIAGAKVLVVDDEPDTRALVKRLLEDCKAVVSLAATAEEAFGRLQDERPDVLITDIGMPGEDGYALMRRIRRLGPEHGGKTPAIALTAYARSEDRMKSIVAGFQHHVAKPVEAAELITLVYSLVRR